MAVLDNIISGSFTSAGTPVILNLPSDVDFFFCENLTQAATTQSTGRAVRCEYHRGMAADSQIRYFKDNSGNGLNMTVDTSGGFTLVNSSQNSVGAPLTISTGISQASPAVVTLASTAGLSNGDIVRVINSTGMLQIAGMDFTIGSVTTNTSFTLAYLDSSGFAAAATGGTIRRIAYDSIFYPRRRYITKITQAASAVITMSVTHGLTVGQRVTIIVPNAFGMIEMNNQNLVITAIDTTNNTITVNIDSTGFTAFAFPASASYTATFPQVVPFGDAPPTIANTNALQSVLDGATYNTALYGIRLAAGVQSPAGSSSDVIRWVAQKSSQVQS